MTPFLGNLAMILCLLIGMGLIVLEAMIPGFGLPGITGIILEVIGLELAWVWLSPALAAGITFGMLVLIALAIFLCYRSALKGRLSKSPLVLKDRETPSASETDLSHLIHQQAITVTALRPVGIIEIGGKRMNAVSEGEYIEKDTDVLIVSISGDSVNVRSIEK